MKTTKVLWLAPLLGMLALPVLAADDDGDRRHSHREDRQQTRIEHGVRKGDLTRNETRKLHHEQRQIAKTERHYRRDGQVDRQERRDLEQRRNHASGHIYKLRHNDHDRDHRHKYEYRYRDRGHHYGWHKDHPRYSGHQHKRPHWHGHRDGHASHGRYYDGNGWSVVIGAWDRW
jgi:hypothetical protein